MYGRHSDNESIYWTKSLNQENILINGEGLIFNRFKAEFKKMRMPVILSHFKCSNLTSDPMQNSIHYASPLQGSPTYVLPLSDAHRHQDLKLNAFLHRQPVQFQTYKARYKPELSLQGWCRWSRNLGLKLCAGGDFNPRPLA